MFLNEDFLLTTDYAKTLYHNFAKKQPIIDYHCHLSPQEIYEDTNFMSITEAWLSGDHYKWRLMRAHGVDERNITGDGSDWDKFLAFAQTLEKAIGNPLYAWSHLELKRFFGIKTVLNEKSAKQVFDEANTKLKEASMSRRNLIANSNVKVVCTTDDPIDSLEFHKKLALEETRFKVLPAFRPDKSLNINAQGFVEWVNALSDVSGVTITGYQDLVSALANRIDYFDSVGCSVSDHALDSFNYVEVSSEDVDAIFKKGMTQTSLKSEDVDAYKTALMKDLMKLYHAKSWTAQLHFKALRNLNKAMFNTLGADVGFDGLNDETFIKDVAELFSALELNNALPRTIVYSLNENDYLGLLTMLGCFQKDSAMKIQLGSAWWFNDTRTGMRKQLQAFAEQSLLGHFVGMLTDSRSFLSYTRHEYFRRVLCELVGEWVERGELPFDEDALGALISDISYGNVAKQFNF